jgi:hypothetical protein
MMDGQGVGSTIEVDTRLSLDSTNPVQNKVIAEALNTKLDKMNPPISVNGGTYAYSATITSKESGSNVTHSRTEISASATVNTIPLRGSSGNFYVGPPIVGGHCTNKDYVDTLLEGKLDKITSTGLIKLYGVGANGEQTSYVLASSANACQTSRIAQYFSIDNAQGDIQPPACLLTRIPQKPYQCANKQFVEDLVASVGGGEKRYKHTVSFVGVAGHFEIVSTIQTSLIPAVLEIPGEEQPASHTQVPSGFLESIRSITYYHNGTENTSTCLIMIGMTFAENCIKTICWPESVNGGEIMLQSINLPKLSSDTVTPYPPEGE